MGFDFNDDWADEIAEVTTSREYQNIDVKILDNSEVGADDYDVDTDTWDLPAENVVYSGQARIIGVRWGTEQGGESQANATTLKAIRVQLSPNCPWARIRKGLPLFVTKSVKNPVLLEYTFTVTSDFQGGMPASRTIEASLDGDSAHA